MDIASCADSRRLGELQRAVDGSRHLSVRFEQLLRNWLLGQESARGMREKTIAESKKFYQLWQEDYVDLSIAVPTEHKPSAKDVVFVCLLRGLYCSNLPVVDGRCKETQPEAFPGLLQQECLAHERSTDELSVHEVMLSLHTLVNSWCGKQYVEGEHFVYINCLLRRIAELACFVWTTEVADDDRFTSMVHTPSITNGETHFAVNTHFIREANTVCHSLLCKSTAREKMRLSDRWQSQCTDTVRKNLIRYLKTCYSKDIMQVTEKILISTQVCIGERARHHFARPLVVADNDAIIRHFRPESYTEITQVMDALTLEAGGGGGGDLSDLAAAILAQQVVDYVMKQNSFIYMSSYVHYDVDDHKSCFFPLETDDPWLVKDCGLIRVRVRDVLSTETNVDAVCLWVLLNSRRKLSDGTDLKHALSVLVQDELFDLFVPSINTMTFGLP